VDSASQGPLSDYTFADITGPHSIGAIFDLGEYTLMATSGGNGNIVQNTQNPVTGLMAIDFTITPDTGYVVASVTLDGTPGLGTLTPSADATEYTYTTPPVTGNHAVSVTFIEPTITVVEEGGGTVSPGPGNVPVQMGDSQTFQMVPGAGNIISDVLVDGVSKLSEVRENEFYDFTNVIANHTFRVVFDVPKVVTVIVIGSDNGTIDPPDPQTAVKKG